MFLYYLCEVVKTHRGAVIFILLIVKQDFPPVKLMKGKHAVVLCTERTKQLSKNTSPSSLPLPLGSLPFNSPFDSPLQTQDHSPNVIVFTVHATSSSLRAAPTQFNTYLIKSSAFPRRLWAFIALISRVFSFLIFISKDIVIRRHAEVVILFDEQLNLLSRRQRVNVTLTSTNKWEYC